MRYEDPKSTWNSGMWKAIRRGSVQQEVRKHRDRVTGAWKQISKQRRQVDVCYDPSMVTALRHATWMDAESFKKTFIKEEEKRGGTHQPFYGTWVVDFMPRQDAGRFMQGKYLSDRKFPEAIEELRKRTTTGASTFLVKVKVHRGEPANEEANKSISSKNVATFFSRVRVAVCLGVRVCVCVCQCCKKTDNRFFLEESRLEARSQST